MMNKYINITDDDYRKVASNVTNTLSMFGRSQDIEKPFDHNKFTWLSDVTEAPKMFVQEILNVFAVTYPFLNKINVETCNRLSVRR